VVSSRFVFFGLQIFHLGLGECLSAAVGTSWYVISNRSCWIMWSMLLVVSKQHQHLLSCQGREVCSLLSFCYPFGSSLMWIGYRSAFLCTEKDRMTIYDLLAPCVYGECNAFHLKLFLLTVKSAPAVVKIEQMRLWEFSWVQIQSLFLLAQQVGQGSILVVTIILSKPKLGIASGVPTFAELVNSVK